MASVSIKTSAFCIAIISLTSCVTSFTPALDVKIGRRVRPVSDLRDATTSDFDNEIGFLWDELTQGDQQKEILSLWDNAAMVVQQQQQAKEPSIWQSQQRIDSSNENVGQLPTMGLSLLGSRSDFIQTFEKIKSTYKESRELEAAGKLSDNDVMSYVEDVVGADGVMMEKVLVHFAAEWGRRTARVFGGVDPSNWLE